ncbi:MULTISPECIES: DUF4838 domain-containing protein [unclassified Micromonospora]|uniref:DUF4838 domain-containing protein n=1 Tax=unclassified Micromonospora TaxID=2617518 RepID=UPI003316DDD1
MPIAETEPGGTSLTRRTVLRASVAAGIATAVGSVSPTPAHATPAPRLKLADGGRTRYVIYVGAREGAVVRHAANELSEYLQAITSATFPVVAADRPPASGHLLVVGRDNPVAARWPSTIDYDGLSDDGFALRTSRDNVLIASAEPRGTLYGVYWLLDHLCGVRWLSSDYTIVPTESVLTIPTSDLNDDQVPRFRFRTILAGDANDAAYRQHNMLNGRRDQYWTVPRPAGIDTWSSYWPEERPYSYHQVVTDSTHWSGSQLTAMNPETRALAATSLVEIIRRRTAAGEDLSASFHQEDTGWTPDPASQAFANAHGGALSAPIIDMTNDVARRVRQEIPGARLSAQAYGFSFAPPTGVTVDDSVVLTIAALHADFGQSLFGEKNKEIGDSIRTWSRLANHIVMWDYLTGFNSYIIPFPDWWAMCESVQTLATLPTVQGYFGQGAWNAAGTEFSHLRIWVISRLLWNPRLDADKLIREFLRGYYGAAADSIYAYMQVMRKSVADTSTNLSWLTFVGSPHLGFAAMREADALLSQAEAAVRQDAARLKHVRALRMTVDYVILVRTNEYVQAAAVAGVDWDPDTQNRLNRFELELADSGLTRFNELGGTPAELLALMRIAASPATPPAVTNGLPSSDWIDFQEPHLKLYAPVTTILADDKSSNRHTVRMPGNRPDWGVQLPLGSLPPGGTWKLYVSVRADTGSAPATAKAIELGVYPHPESVISVPVEQLSDGLYHEIPIPGTYESDSSKMVYAAPPNSPEIAAVYVDRVFAVRV